MGYDVLKHQHIVRHGLALLAAKLRQDLEARDIFVTSVRQQLQDCAGAYVAIDAAIYEKS